MQIVRSRKAYLVFSRNKLWYHHIPNIEFKALSGWEWETLIKFDENGASYSAHPRYDGVIKWEYTYRLNFWVGREYAYRPGLHPIWK